MVSLLADDTAIDELFTWTSLATLWGSAAAAFVGGNALGALFGFLGRAVSYIRLWVAFGIAMAIEVGLAASAADGARKWVVAILNGFLVFTSAMGLNEGADKLPKPKLTEGFQQGGRPAFRFVTTWLKP
jgi:hypothetical protein